MPVAAFAYKEGGPRVETPPPTLGADTAAILKRLGYTPAAIRKLRAEGVV